MSPKKEKPTPEPDSSNTPKTAKSDAPNESPKNFNWDFFTKIPKLLEAFPEATTGQKAAIVAMSFFVILFLGGGLVGIFTLPVWAVICMFVLVLVFVFATAVLLLYIESKATTPFRCRQIPVFPPTPGALVVLKAGLEEIRQDASDYLIKELTNIHDDKIRANIFLLANMEGGTADGSWMLVINDDLAINMNKPAECQLQLNIGQGATGVAFRDGTHQLTRRQSTSTGQWDRKFLMTPALESQIHEDLKWIVSFPLLKPNTREAVGVLNIDGLEYVNDNDVLNKMATSVLDKVAEISKYLSLQPSICVGKDQLGVMKNA